MIPEQETEVGLPDQESLSENIKRIDDQSAVETENTFMLIDFAVLVDIIDIVSKCPECSCKLSITNNTSSRMGFSNNVRLSCSVCSWERLWFLSKECSPKVSRGRKYHEVNVRMAIAFREIGKGHQNFSRIMNMHCMSNSSYLNLYEDLYNAYEDAAESIKSGAALEIKQLGGKIIQGNTLCQCSVDGTWQKRGHSMVL